MRDHVDGQVEQLKAGFGAAKASAAKMWSLRATFGHFTQTGPWSDVRELNWPELGTLLTTHTIGVKDGSCIVPATFRFGRRRKADAEQIDVVFLDSDAGATLDQIATAITARGWSAIISSTHSHLTTRTTARRGNWDSFCLKLTRIRGHPEA